MKVPTGWFLLCCILGCAKGLDDSWTVIRVTNLDESGPGSLRAALEARGPRLVVFEVGGVIDLKGRDLKIAEPYVYVAGETAPSPGITVIRGGLVITTHHVTLRHLRIRPGDAGRPKRSGWEPEVTTIAAHHVVVDHCSISWGVDENLSASGPRTLGPEATSHDITFSYNFITEGLRDSTHSKGPHSMGTLIHDSCTNVTIVGNFYAHNNARNPYFKAFTTGAVVNNLIYNPGSAAITVNYVESEWAGTGIAPQPARIAVVGNVLVYGVDTRDGLPLVSGRGEVFLQDNLAWDRSGRPVPLAGPGIRTLEVAPFWPSGLKALPASAVIEHVLRNAGARPKDRDAVDLRTIREFYERKGRIIDSQQEVGGYPAAPATRRRLEIPRRQLVRWLERFTSEVEFR